VQPLCSRVSVVIKGKANTHHRGTENTEAAQSVSKYVTTLDQPLPDAANKEGRMKRPSRIVNAYDGQT